jgi:enoyl-CoA hydratase
MTFNNLLVADSGAVRTITINRPDKLNALNQLTIAELDAAFAAAGSEAAVRAVILTGSGSKAFVAGADITELANTPAAELLAFSRAGQAMMTRVERLGKPVIAMIPGFALGGGLELAMCCHIRIVSETAKLGLPEINLGLLPGFGGTQRLLRLAGRAATLELTLTGKPIDATRAAALGIVNRVVPAAELEAATRMLADELAAKAPHAVRGVLSAVLLGGEAAIDTGLDYEAQAFGVCAATDDMREGTRAFLEKRPANFTGR